MAERRSQNSLFIEGNFNYGCIEVQDLAALSLNTATFLSAPNKLNILLISYLDEPWKGESHIAIHMFQLPQGQDEFDRIQAWFGKERKTRARLPDGVPFEESTLAIGNLPPDWKHTAYPRSCRDFIHVYTSDNQAVLLRVKSKRGTVLNHPLLRIAAEKIRIVPSQWESQPPKIRIRKMDANMESFALDTSQFSEILAFSKAAMDWLRITEDDQGSHCVERINDGIESVRSRTRQTKRDDAKLAQELGCLWGTALLETGEWEWRTTRLAGQEFLAVFNKAGTHAIAPAVLINKLLKSKNANNNMLLLYNMIRVNKLPDTIDGQVVWLS